VNFIAATEALLRRIGIGGGLAAQGIGESSLEMLAQAAFRGYLPPSRIPCRSRKRIFSNSIARPLN